MAKTTLAFIADLHYYSPKLGVTGRAYDLRQGSDQKCLAESGAIIVISTCNLLAPSTLAASSSEIGIVSKNPFEI